jgi:fatty acid desaturase
MQDLTHDSRSRKWHRAGIALVHQIALLLPFPGVYLLATEGWQDQVLVTVGLWLWTAYFLFCWTSTFHETAHQTLSQPTWFTVLMGRIIGTVLLTPYTVYRESHIRHHAYLNRPNDWELWPYSDPGCSLWFRRIFVWVDLLCGFITSPWIYGRIYFHSASPIKQPAIRRAILMEYCVMFTFWASVLTWVISAGYWSQFLLAWGIPHWLAGILQTGRKFTEHLGMASFDPLQGTRTVIGTNWLTRLSSFLNFEIFVHGPHHRFPKVEHQNLECRMNELMSRSADASFPVYGSYLAATRAMLPHLVRGPGVGLNAGASGENRVKQDDVQEFLDDAKLITDGGW